LHLTTYPSFHPRNSLIFILRFVSVRPPSGHAAPTLLSLIGFQGALELAGGFLILIGLFSRPVAFVLAGDMAVAYFMVHAPKSFFPTLNGGQLAILFCFVFLYLAVAGGGEWSADELLARSRAR
jgi:putative oxidoreductase